MIFTETKLKGAYQIDVERIEDERGFFGRSFCETQFLQHGLNAKTVQTNVSCSTKKGTLRGMHMQLAPFEETKLIRCTKGAIYDVIVDMRPESETFKQWFGIELNDSSYRMLYVPGGFAHGFITLEDDTHVNYQVSQCYAPSAEKGYRWDDPAFNIKWPFTPTLVSAKDSNHPLFEMVTENNI
jgi:dTDP-4-dehydrorhamnose 3,5-epimerase